MLQSATLFHVRDHSTRLRDRCEYFSARMRDRFFYALGDFGPSDWERKSIAIVGSRSPTAYGIRFVRDFIAALGDLDCTILSGGALGIDGEVHAAALRNKMKTQAWLVGPIARPSPRSHQNLFANLQSKSGCGLLVPRFLEPSSGIRPLKRNWLLRNAWLAAASDVMIVVEGNVNSGTWSTAKIAGEFGIPVYLLPGSIFSSQSQGVNAMIARGYGHPILSVENLVKSLVVELGGKPYNYRGRSEAALIGQQSQGPIQPKGLDYTRNYLNLASGGIELRNIWRMAEDSSLSVAELLESLEWLEVRGELRRAGDRFERKGSL